MWGNGLVFRHFTTITVTVSIAKHLFSRGPNEHFFEPRLASPSEDDQVNMVHFRAVHNLFDRVSNSDIRFEVNAQIFGSLNDFLEVFLVVLASVIEHGIHFD